MNKTDDWNTRYKESKHLFGTAPNDFMVYQKSRIKPCTNALSIADGEANNSIWLAKQGLTVTSIDISTEANKKAQSNQLSSQTDFTLICADILQYPLPEVSFDLITVFFLHLPTHQRKVLNKKINQLLKPNGILLYECFHTDQSQITWGLPDADLRLNENDFQRDFFNLTTLTIDKKLTVSYEETRGKKEVVTLQYAGLKKND